MTAKTAQWARVLDAADYELRHRNVIEAARFCEAHGVAKAAISIKARNRAGMATRCEVIAPAGVYAA